MKDGGRELQLETYRLQSVKSFLKNEKQLDINASQKKTISGTQMTPYSRIDKHNKKLSGYNASPLHCHQDLFLSNSEEQCCKTRAAGVLLHTVLPPASCMSLSRGRHMMLKHNKHHEELNCLPSSHSTYIFQMFH